MKLRVLSLGLIVGSMSVTATAEPVRISKAMVVQNCATNVVPERKLEITKCDFYDPVRHVSVQHEIAPSRKYTLNAKEENRGIFSDQQILNFVINARLNKVSLDIAVGSRGVVGVSTTKLGSLESDGYSAFVNTDVLSEKEQAEFEKSLEK